MTKQKHPAHWGGKADPEQLDPTPMEMPFGTTRPTPIHELIARMVAQEVARERDEVFESFDEADDFEEDSDELLDMSPYELKELEPDAPGFEIESEAAPEPLPEPKGDDPGGDPPDDAEGRTELSGEA